MFKNEKEKGLQEGSIRENLDAVEGVRYISIQRRLYEYFVVKRAYVEYADAIEEAYTNTSSTFSYLHNWKTSIQIWYTNISNFLR